MPDTFATINGHSLRYRLEGEGPLVVFGHGLLGSIEQVAHFTDRLDGVRERVRLLLYDARGHGQSEGPEEPGGYSWEIFGRDMAALVAHAGETQAILAGGSMGAAASLWVALEQPEVPRALILYTPPPLGPDAIHAEEERQAIQMLNVLATAIQGFGLEQTVRMARQFLPADATEQAKMQLDQLLLQNPRTLPHVIAGLMAAQRHAIEDYGRIRVPTLIIAHEGDGLHPMRSAKLLSEQIQGARLAVGPQPGYWQAHPDEFTREVDAFLRDVG